MIPGAIGSPFAAMRKRNLLAEFEEDTNYARFFIRNPSAGHILLSRHLKTNESGVISLVVNPRGMRGSEGGSDIHARVLVMEGQVGNRKSK